jgi:hypothetical protein
MYVYLRLRAARLSSISVLCVYLHLRAACHSSIMIPVLCHEQCRWETQVPQTNAAVTV